jgi:aldehyde:ferredoxin oxidoreductase
MKPIQVTLPRYKPMFGWTNRILRVDLSEGRIWAQESAPYVPEFIGARGIAHKILWDEYPEPVDPFDPRNPFMVIPGALTGTIAPYSGRTNVCAFSPQSHPYNWFTRASIGFDWGAKLKRAGYDGLVVTGASETPVHILIRDDEVSILPADGGSADGPSGDASSADALWGLDTIETQEVIQATYGKSARTLTIGPAGERLSRIATVHTATSSVAGQGGFGAVMGAKKLKAITVIGSGRVPVADPDRLRGLFKAVGQEVGTSRGRGRWLDMLNERLAREGGGRARRFACTASCPTPCHIQFDGVQGCHFDRKWSGAMLCVSGLFGGSRRPIGVYDWSLGLRGGFELNMYANRLGLNHWDILIGMIPWLRTCNRQGSLPEVNGHAFDLNDVDFWVALLHDMAYREGMGDALAEGGWLAAQRLNLGVEWMRRYYTGWGYAGHWDGHGDFVNPIVYPFWIVAALHWAMDTRDPASSTHGYIQNVTYRGPFGRRHGDNPPITWDHMRGIGQRVYGRADTLDPLSGYEGKALPAAYHGVRAIMKDCLPTDDQVFPLIYSDHSEDRFSRIVDPNGGTIDGPDVDAAILRAGTGLDWDTAAFEQAAERVLNLERATVIRHWGRTRAMDERVLPSFEYDEDHVNPELGVRMVLDRAQFLPVMDEYYRLRGWDVETGWPTPERLESLGLDDVHGEMVAGAVKARARLPDLPPVEPVVDVHQDDPDRVEEREASSASA